MSTKYIEILNKLAKKLDVVLRWWELKFKRNINDIPLT